MLFLIGLHCFLSLDPVFAHTARYGKSNQKINSLSKDLSGRNHPHPDHRIRIKSAS